MPKVKINKLPEGYVIENGKVVKKQMQKGGKTGDQIGFSLKTYPTDTDGGNSKKDDVRYSLSSVPRDVANLEAEGGETVLTDLNNDGLYGLYDIKGPRHSKGGVPLYLPEQSFVYSDFRDMNIKGKDLAEYGIETKKSMTPAKVSRKFQLNKYYGAIDDEFADDIQVNSADLMLKKNKMNLSKLAFNQELSKNFEDGVPVTSHPYLVSIGEDPIEFTAKVEDMTKQQALMKTLNSMPPQQQQQVLALQKFMEQVHQMKQGQGMQQQAAPQEQMMQQQMMQQQGPPMMRRGGMIPPPPPPNMYYAQKGGKVTDYTLDLSGLTKLDTGTAGRDAYAELENLIQNDASFEPVLKLAYDLYLKKLKEVEGKFGPQQAYSYPDMVNEFLAYQKNNYTISDLLATQKAPDGKLYRLHPNLDHSLYGDGKTYNTQTQSLFDKTEELAADPDVYTAYQINDRNTIANQAFYQALFEAQKELNNERLFLNQLGPREDKNYANNLLISRIDKIFGNNTLGHLFGVTPAPEPEKPKEVNIPEPEPCENAAELEAECNAKENHRWIPYNAETGDGCACMPLPGEAEERKPPKPEMWLQDLLKLNSIANRDRDIFLPWQPDVENVNVDYVLEDPTRAVAAINEQMNIMNQANNAFAGVQAGSARSASTAGKAMEQIANTVGQVQNRNVSTVNRAYSQNAQMDALANRTRDDRNVKEYDDTALALQSYMDEKNFDREQYADAYANAVTNMANTYNLNLMQDYYQTDPMTGGMIHQVSGKAFDPVQEPDKTEQYFNTAARLKREGIEPTHEMITYILGDPDSRSKQTNIQREYNESKNVNPNNSYPGNIDASGRRRQYRRGSELKRYASPFYIGKMGI